MQPGIYRMSFRGLSLAEAWRFGGEPLKFTIALVLKLLAAKGPRQRLPTYAAERECDPAEVPAGEHQRFLAEIKIALDLGYAQGWFQTNREILDPSLVDGYGYTALHEDRRRAIFIGGIRNRVLDKVNYNLATTGSLRTIESDDVEFVNHRFFMDSPPPSRKIWVRTRGIRAIDQAMLAHLEHTQAIPFADYAELKQHSNRMSDRAFDARIARGLFVFEKADGEGTGT